MKKIHFHSDLGYFGGCENMIANFLNSNELREKFQVSFSFRNSPIYLQGLRKRILFNDQIFPLNLPVFAIHRRQLARRRGNALKIIHFLRHAIEYLPIFLLSIYRLQELFRTTAPDVVHINNGGYPGAISCRAAVVAAKISGIKNVIFVVNNMALNYRHPYRWLDYIFDRFISKNVDVFITGSNVASAQLQKVIKSKKSSFLVIPNGISPREVTESMLQTRHRLNLLGEFDCIFGIVGVMEPRKGHLFLLESILEYRARLISESLKVKFLIEGEGGILQTLEHFVSINRMESIVQFVGTEESIFNFFHAIDCLIYPSVVDEDFPNVISEAMSVEKPIISTKVAGATDQIADRVSGLLVGVNDKHGLWCAIEKMAKDKEMRTVMGKESKQRFEKHFTATHSVTQYENLYESLS